ncbi:23S rRNA (guanosine(2251)-2'-O)-methyltransferase RlmB [Mycoplasmopsis synoviae]|uniref:23S rRNA (guanosine(2251)-2'-O)-methyltransferase RlmB n=1 Tax=Mycoplasmopsis synoviae TaxID=2109 RepID=UPI0035645D41
MAKLFIGGKNSTLDAIESKLNLKRIYLSKKENLKYFKNTNFKVEILSNLELSKLTNNANHQGFVAELDFTYSDINKIYESKPKIVLVLDHIMDTYNLGAIIRSANAAGIKDIVMPKENCADITSNVLKVSSGGFIGLNFYKVSSLNAFLNKLKKHSYWIYGSMLDKNSTSYYSAKYNFPMAFILGNEEKGISKSALVEVDEKIHIPQSGSVESLNVSVAAGILLFDIKHKVNE